MKLSVNFMDFNTNQKQICISLDDYKNVVIGYEIEQFEYKNAGSITFHFFSGQTEEDIYIESVEDFQMVDEVIFIGEVGIDECTEEDFLKYTGLTDMKQVRKEIKAFVKRIINDDLKMNPQHYE